MLGFFPDPYPDELLYSVCSRYHKRTRYKSKSQTMTDLFKGAHTLSLWLPSGLDRLISALPLGHQYSADRLIDENTLLPFYGSFLSPQRLNLLRASMRQGLSDTSTYIHVGITVGSANIGYLRLCQYCAEEDKELFGEPYWHRLHQVLGVEVCFKHNIFLDQSKVGARLNRGTRETFITAGGVKLTTPPRPLILSNSVHRIYIQLARDIFWLLNQRDLFIHPTHLHGCYICIMLNKGMISTSSTRRLTPFRKRFQEYFTLDLLASLSRSLEGDDHWLYRLLRLGGGPQPPLNHLLLIHFLGYAVEDFFALFLANSRSGNAHSYLPSKHTCEEFERAIQA